MEITSERYYPWIYNPALMPFEPFISYEHWHRYRYAAAFVAGKAVLDIASGEGYGSAFLAQHAASVVGVDLHEQAVGHARAHYPRPNLTFLCGSAGAIPIAGQHLFDVVVSFETIEHLDAATQTAFAAEVKRLLKPDGVLLMSTPNRTLYSDPHPDKNPYHLREFTTAEFAAFLQAHFGHVRLLSQHLYPTSYIWNLSGESQSLREYQMALVEERFEPTTGDGKETLYLIAVCTDDAERAAGLAVPDSLLLDLTEVAFHGLPEGRDHFHTSKLYVDTGAGFQEEIACHRMVDFREEQFTVTFPLREFGTIQRLRWDPLEQRFCRLRVREVRWEDGDGATHTFDLKRLTTNGTAGADGFVTFETLDPIVRLPIAGEVRSVTIEGECAVASADASLTELDHLAGSRADLLRQRERELAAIREAAQAREQELYAREHIHETSLYVDTGSGFREEVSCRQTLDFREGCFAVTFALQGFGPVKCLRWDPIERRLCRLRIRAVRWEDGDGATHRLDPNLLTTNGVACPDGLVTFATIDPTVILPIAGSVQSVTIEADCTLSTADRSLAELEHLAQTREGRLQAQAWELDAAREEMRTRDEQLQERNRQIELLTARLQAREVDLQAAWRQIRELEEARRRREREVLAVGEVIEEMRQQFVLSVCP